MGQRLLFILFRDHIGRWCAAPPGFRDILRDPIGTGETRIEAMQALLVHPDFVHRARMGEWAERPGYSDFVEAMPNDAPDLPGGMPQSSPILL
jgi:hypothetical protein